MYKTKTFSFIYKGKSWAETSHLMYFLRIEEKRDLKKHLCQKKRRKKQLKVEYREISNYHQEVRQWVFQNATEGERGENTSSLFL